VDLYEENDRQNEVSVGKMEKDDDDKYVKTPEIDDDKNENNHAIDDDNNVKHPYLRGVLSLSRAVHSTWPLHSSSNSVHVMFCVVWLLTWCLVGTLLMKLFSRIKLWRRGCC